MSEKLTREECENALSDLFENHDRYLSTSRKLLLIMEKLIKEHFDNSPLKFEELEEGRLYWDNVQKEWCFLTIICGEYPHMKYFDGYIDDSKFEENRFYRKQVEE